MQIDERPLDENAGRLRTALSAARIVAWEFDVARGQLEYSTSADAQDYWIRVDDQTLIAELLDHALRGSGPYTAEFRVTSPAGAVKRTQYRGEVIRDAEQKPVRVAGIAMTISDSAGTEELLRSIAAGVSVTTGETFFRLLVERLSAVLQTDSACVSAIDENNPEVFRTVALFVGGQFSDVMEYRLGGTPCEEALKVGRSSYPRDVQSAFPHFHWLVEMGIESYLGVPLIGSNGQVLGVMSVMSRAPLKNVNSAEIILNIFASRASSELERIRSTSDKKRVETELEEKQRFIRQVAATTINVLFVYDIVERRNVYVNERSVDVIGYTPREILDMGRDFIPHSLHPEDVVSLAQLAQEYATRQDGEVFEHVFRMKHKNGQWRWVNRTATVFSRMPDGRPRQILGAVTDITRFKETEVELRSLSARLLNIQDEERRRIARELHDVTGQNLAAIGFNLATLERTASLETRAKDILLECERLCVQSQKEIRTLSYLLHPPMLDEMGLFGALEWYIEGLKKRTDMDIVLYVQRGIGRLSLELETDLFRVIQEALTNIIRYSGSAITVIRFEAKDGRLILQIEDQGRGLEMKAGANEDRRDFGLGVGIPGMRERLRQHGGTLDIKSGGQGTTLTVVVPTLLPRVSGQSAG